MWFSHIFTRDKAIMWPVPALHSSLVFWLKLGCLSLQAVPTSPTSPWLSTSQLPISLSSALVRLG